MMDGWVSVVQHRPLLHVFCCSLAFRLLHTILKTFPRPQSFRSDPWKCWKYENLLVSLVHSLLSGTWAIFCVFQNPAMVYELHSTFTPLAYLLVIVSTGYFIQDAVDLVFSGYFRESWEILFHHFLVIWTFGYAVLTRHYVSGAVIALFVEVNNVFLHLRLMMKMAGLARDSFIYTMNKMVNVVTYVSVRLGAQFYLTWYILVNYSQLDHALYFLISMMLMNIMILVYFYRLLRADFFNKHSHQNSIRKLVQD